MELTQHGGGGKLVNDCEDLPGRVPAAPAAAELCRLADDPGLSAREAHVATCSRYGAKFRCCLCQGGKREKMKHLAGKLDMEILKINAAVDATATFVPEFDCRDPDGRTKRIPLRHKTPAATGAIDNIYRDLDAIVKHLCNLDVAPLRARVAELGDEGFTDTYQLAHGNAVASIGGVARLKPGCTAIQLVFSSKRGDQVFHFPWLDAWLPLLQEHVLGPLGISLDRILRMQLADMPPGSEIKLHADKNPWVGVAHRTHVPIVTHDDLFFLTKIGNQTLRIKAGAGEVFEFNNGKAHAVQNIGASRIHLIIDHLEAPIYDEGDAASEAMVKLRPGQVCTQRNIFFECTDSNAEKNEEL